MKRTTVLGMVAALMLATLGDAQIASAKGGRSGSSAGSRGAGSSRSFSGGSASRMSASRLPAARMSPSRMTSGVNGGAVKSGNFGQVATRPAGGFSGQVKRGPVTRIPVEQIRRPPIGDVARRTAIDKVGRLPIKDIDPVKGIGRPAFPRPGEVAKPPKLPLPGDLVDVRKPPKLPGDITVPPKHPLPLPLPPKHPLPLPPKHPPICPPPHCPPPYCPPHDDHCHHHCPPIRIWLPAYPCPTVVTEEVVVVEEVPVIGPADAVAESPVAEEASVEEAAAESAKSTEAPAADKLPTVPVGSTLTLEGAELGEKEGRVLLQIAGVSMPAKIEKWEATSAMATLPMLGLAESTTAQVHVFNAQAKLVNTIAIQLVPAAESSQTQPAADAAKTAADDAKDPAVAQAQVASN